ncbi:MAG: flagellar hook-basal body protein [Clostridia bacterium]|nr:flagellar hook-basal body protein [Clostridia bacterium]
MIRGLYTSGWSMLANSKKMDVISNNLANVSTNGYKRDLVVFESFPDVLARRLNDTRSPLNPSGKVGSMELGSDIGEIFTNYKQGQLTKSGSNLDIAFHGTDTAFFSIGIPGENGGMKEYYTRDGAFVLNADRQLVTKDGYPVLGQNGIITLDSENFSVSSDGSIFQNGELVDKLKIKDFKDTTALRKYGSNLLSAEGDVQEQPFSGVVAQGFIEQSNVNIIREMVDMIAVTRSYESSQKLLQAQDSTLEKAVNEVGAVR